MKSSITRRVKDKSSAVYGLIVNETMKRKKRSKKVVEACQSKETARVSTINAIKASEQEIHLRQAKRQRTDKTHLKYYHKNHEKTTQECELKDERRIMCE